MTADEGRQVSGSPHLRFDDLEAGACYESYARTVTESDVMLFTGLTGLRGRMFIDDHFARQQAPFHARIAPGFLTASIAGGMIESVIGPDVIAGLGTDRLRFPVAVRIGDTVHTRVTVLSRKVSRDARKGVCVLQAEVFNQTGEIVLTFETTVMMRRDVNDTAGKA